jgi:YbbR domain-containing protein
MAVVETVPVDVEEGRGGIKRRVRLSNDGKPLSIVPDQVEVIVNIQEEQASRAFERIEVQAKDFKGVYNVVPQSVSLRVAGPKSAVEKLTLTSDEVYLNLKGLPAGEHQVPLEMNLPVDIQVVEQKPQRFRVRIIKPAE